MSDLGTLLSELGRSPGERLAIGTRRPGRRFAASIATVAAARDRDPVPDDRDVWYGAAPLAVSVPGGKGHARDVIGLRELYADLDVKPGGMPDLQAAEGVIKDLAGLLGTEPVAVVSTGGGLQPHWRIEQDEATSWPGPDDPRWQDAVVLMRRWGRLVAVIAERHGGHVDSVYNLDRVLRAPGTFNHKYDPPRPVTVRWFKTSPVSLRTIQDALDEWGVDELPEDRRLVDEQISPPAEWGWASTTCTYAQEMVAGWSTDRPEARHPWLVSQALRLAAAHRLGCLAEPDHAAARKLLARRFAQVVALPPAREPGPGEVASAVGWGREHVAAMTTERVWAELGQHEHVPELPDFTEELEVESDDEPGKDQDGDEVDEESSLVDLTPFLDGTYQPPTPSTGPARDDGRHLLYPGRWHTCIGLTGCGKTWLGLLAARDVMLAGGTVMYLHFEEAHPAGTVDRLRAMAVPVEIIRERFRWFNVERMKPYRRDLTRSEPTLVVLDGINAACSRHGQDVQRTEAVGWYRQALVSPATGLGAAVLSLGHPPKARDRQDERHGYGSTAWLDEVDGVGFRLEAGRTPVRRGGTGTAKIHSVKDRYGEVERGGEPGGSEGWVYLGSLVVEDGGPAEVTPGNDMVPTTRVRISSPNREEAGDGIDRLAGAIAEVLADQGAIAGQQRLSAALREAGHKHDKGDIAAALIRLERAGRVVLTSGPRGAQVAQIVLEEQS